ncbi:glycosyltransferase family 2 protein [uncultured Desulfuromonas sp.]|uniref:glycosyltransferase family 2 protein n=1 Tax=uncultured Desulfuromonas sp. TaxID=181013 RepID=UPI002AAC27D5|nr:glycosyltransferase family 2 protein [uncultured Desulfuromonas sp.]
MSRRWHDLTVVIVNYNGATWLHRCLSALFSQELLPGEVLLVDNASTDHSLEIVETFPEVRVLAQSENLGFAGGNNLALRHLDAPCRWVALLNADAFVGEDWLAVLQRATQDAPDYAALGSRLLEASNPRILDGLGDCCHISGRVGRLHHGQKDSGAGPLQEVFSVCAAAALYQRSALEAVGGFDDDFFCFVEDVDLGFRLRLAGFSAAVVPRATVHHVGAGSSGGRFSPFAVYHGHRNLLWLYVKNMPGALFWLFLPLHLGVQLAAIGRCVVRGQTRCVLHAKRDSLLGLGHAWRKRRRIQSGRSTSVYAIFTTLTKIP